MSGPVDVMGVVAFPNENGKRECRFIDMDYNTLFTVPDGENIVVNYLDGRSAVFLCRYLDDAHVVVDGRAYHIMELAETMQRQSAVSRPESPKEGDCCDYYEIYQLKTIYWSLCQDHKRKIFREHWCTALNQLCPHAAPFTEKQAL